MPKSQQNNYQGSTIWSYGKAILKKKIPKSLYWQSNTFKNSILPIMKTIQKTNNDIYFHQYSFTNDKTNRFA